MEGEEEVNKMGPKMKMKDHPVSQVMIKNRKINLERLYICRN
jgi:hypothetical protein